MGRIAAGLRAGMSLLMAAGMGWTVLRAEPVELAPAFGEFNDWWGQYAAASPAERPAMVKKGVALAKARREFMVNLIQTDPARAIEEAFTEEYHSALPESIGALVERHVRGLGKLVVAEKRGGTSGRKVTFDGDVWRAWVYGRRLELNSREEIPIHGVVLDGEMAMDGSPLERFPERESLRNVLRQSEGKMTCPICGEPGTIPTAVGDILLWFDTEEHLETCEKALIEKEMNPSAED